MTGHQQHSADYKSTYFSMEIFRLSKISNDSLLPGPQKHGQEILRHFEGYPFGCWNRNIPVYLVNT